MDIYFWILALGLTSGQLIRLPFLGGGITLLDISVLALTILILFKTKFQLRKPLFLIPGLFFILITILSLIFTPLNLTPAETFTSFSYIARFFLYLVFAVSVFSLKKDLSKSFILSGFAIAVLGVLQIIFLPDLRFLAAQGWDPHYFRLVSTFLDPNFTGAFLVLTLILITQKAKINLFFFTLVYLALLLTFSRSSYGMFLISGLVFSVIKKTKKYALITLILFGFLLFGFQVYTRLVASPRNIDRNQSASFRLSTWQQGAILFQKSPLSGIGFNAYRYGIKQYNLGDKKFIASHGSSANDSSLLFVLSTTGILGLAAYIYFLFTLIKTNKILVVGITGLLFHSFFANSLFYSPILLWLLIFSLQKNYPDKQDLF